MAALTGSISDIDFWFERDALPALNDDDLGLNDSIMNLLESSISSLQFADTALLKASATDDFPEVHAPLKERSSRKHHRQFSQPRWMEASNDVVTSSQPSHNGDVGGQLYNNQAAGNETWYGGHQNNDPTIYNNVPAESNHHHRNMHYEHYYGFHMADQHHNSNSYLSSYPGYEQGYGTEKAECYPHKQKHHDYTMPLHAPSSSSPSDFNASIPFENALPEQDSGSSRRGNKNTMPARKNIDRRQEKVVRTATPLQDLGASLFQKDFEFPSTTVCKGQAFAPLRPLSAYNYFFRTERDRILKGCDDDGSNKSSSQRDCSKERSRALVMSHWSQDRTLKRAHRKTHGKISFSELSKRISSRWKALDVSTRSFFKETAAADMERYKKEMDSYLQEKDRQASSS